MKRHRWTWKLAALLGIGLGAYEGVRRYRGAGKPGRKRIGAAIDAALNERTIPLTRADFDAYGDDDAKGWSEWSERQERVA